MSGEKKYSYEKAFKAINYVAGLLRPNCIAERFHIAGSILRKLPAVSDMEIVCIPKIEIKSKDLFDQPDETITDRNFTEALASITDIVLLGNVEGRQMRIRTKSILCPGIVLDLFMPQPYDYFRMLAIRTGSADYSHHVIATAWKRFGWTGVHEIGLRKISECDCHTDGKGKKTYTLKKDLAKISMPPVWNSEHEFFNWLAIKYVAPEYREFHKILNQAL